MTYADLIASEAFADVTSGFDKILSGVKTTHRVKNGYKVSLVNSALHRIFGNGRIAFIDKMESSDTFFITFKDARIGTLHYSVDEELELVASKVIEIEIDLATGEEVEK